MIHRSASETISRRDALRAMCCSLGYMGLPTHTPWIVTDKPKAKHVIFLLMNGGLSQVDSFDYKPLLEKYNGQPLPGLNGHQHDTLMQSPFSFARYGESGIEVSELFPHLSQCVDDMCIVKSVYTDSANHESALEILNAGFAPLHPEVATSHGLRTESRATLKLYGEGQTASSCLTAAQLAERGVRMIQVTHANNHAWDHHFNIHQHRKAARDCDQAFAALIRDLKSRGLFDETIIVAGSEFGRMPTVETGGGSMNGRPHNGRDHNPRGFTMWLAGGGLKRGFTYGATDDFGWKAVENPVHVRDIHATIFHQLGIDPVRTNPDARVIHDLIA